MTGERNGASKLTEDDVLWLRSIPYRRGLFEQLAEELHVNSTTIRKAYQGETWSHVS